MTFDPTYNPFSLVGKTILITGASSGIGRATAIECSKLGATCIITGRNIERLNETLTQMVGEGHQVFIADITQEPDMINLIDQCPLLDGVVNNAGITRKKPISFYKQSDLEDVFQTNTFSPMLLVKYILKKKKLNESASVIFISSISSFSSNIGNGMYGASKAAIRSYMQYCARELSTKKIRANAILPGMIETPLIRGHAFSDSDLQEYMESYPLKRFGTPDEVAYAVIYLLSDASLWVTGTSLVIDGGISLK